MGHTISKPFVADELKQLKKALEKMSFQEVSEQIKKELNSLDSTTLDIAITGESGTGKSSLVNALRGMGDYEKGSAETGAEGETTMKPKKYPHPTFPNVVIWDLPGIGTPKFQAKKYLDMTNFAEYDFFIIVAAERFTENNVLLAKEIQERNRKYYFVRTKVDQSIDNERRRPDFNEEKTLEKIRDYFCGSLKKEHQFNPRVFLLSVQNWDKYDFPLLQNTLENDVDDLKRQVMIEAMSPYSKGALERKKAAMEPLIWKVAFKACAVGTIPFVGSSLACNIDSLKEILVKLCLIFGLDEESLGRLARRVGKPVYELKFAIKKAPLASQITKEFVKDLATKSDVPGVAIKVLECIPVLGSLLGGATSYSAVFHMLKSFLNDVAEDAENVWAKALESQDA